jgi:hypothetical protein
LDLPGAPFAGQSATGLDGALGHYHVIVRQSLGKVEVLLDQEDPDFRIRPDPDRLLDADVDRPLDPLGGLVPHEQPRTSEERASDRQHLLLRGTRSPAAAWPVRATRCPAHRDATPLPTCSTPRRRATAPSSTQLAAVAEARGGSRAQVSLAWLRRNPVVVARPCPQPSRPTWTTPWLGSRLRPPIL